MNITHHGGKHTVTGSCHELNINGVGVLIDCGLVQGKSPKSLNIEFAVRHIKALVLTHSHIDHIGRIPWLLAAGFNQPICCTPATAELVPLMLEDGLKLQLGLNYGQRHRVLDRVKSLIKPIEYGVWQPISRDLPHCAYFGAFRTAISV